MFENSKRIGQKTQKICFKIGKESVKKLIRNRFKKSVKKSAKKLWGLMDFQRYRNKYDFQQKETSKNKQHTSRLELFIG